jgi:hypothetical protein
MRSVQADEGVEHEEDRPHRGDGGLELLPIFGEIETQAGRGDDVDRQLGERDVRRATDAVEPRADQMQGVLSGVQEHRAAPRWGKPAQTRNAAGDGDDHIEREEALAAFGLAADDADGFIGPEVRDQPAALGGTDGQLARTSGLWAREDADHDIPQSREPCREQAQGDRQRRYVRVTRLAQRG